MTAVGKGTTTITVSCGSVKDTCTVVSKGESDGSQIIPSPGSQPSVKPNPDNQPANTPKPSMTPQVPTKGIFRNRHKRSMMGRIAVKWLL